MTIDVNLLMAWDYQTCLSFSGANSCWKKTPYLKWPLALTLWTSARLGLLILVLHERSEDVVALVAVVLDDGELWQDAGGSGHHSACSDQLVQVELTERPKLLHQWQLRDPDVNFLLENEMMYEESTLRCKSQLSVWKSNFGPRLDKCH